MRRASSRVSRFMASPGGAPLNNHRASLSTGLRAAKGPHVRPGRRVKGIGSSRGWVLAETGGDKER
jgi:hypothetical protein